MPDSEWLQYQTVELSLGVTSDVSSYSHSISTEIGTQFDCCVAPGSTLLPACYIAQCILCRERMENEYMGTHACIRHTHRHKHTLMYTLQTISTVSACLTRVSISNIFSTSSSDIQTCIWLQFYLQKFSLLRCTVMYAISVFTSIVFRRKNICWIS